MQITRDDGKTWTNVTPKNWAPGWVYTIEPSQHEKGTAYAAVSRHRTGDMTPHFYKTHDYGLTWTDLAVSLPQNDPDRVLREDPVRKGLLYAATEYKLWISFDDGMSWNPFQLNLPHVPFSDVLIHDNDLLVATEGRGFWILDDITTLRQLSPQTSQAETTLFKPRDTYRISAGGGSHQRETGFREPVNPPNGVILRYAFAAAPSASESVKLDILDVTNTVVRTYLAAAPATLKPELAHASDGSAKVVTGTNSEAGGKAMPANGEPAPGGRNKTLIRTAASSDNGVSPTAALSILRGLNQAVWDLRGAPIPGVSSNGPMMPQGHYSARLTFGARVVSQPFDVLADPRSLSTAEDEKERLILERHIMEVIAATNLMYNELRDVTKQARDLEKQAKEQSSKAEGALHSFIAQLEQIEFRFQPPPGPSGPGGQMILDKGLGPVAQFGPVQTAIDGGDGAINQGDKLRVREVEALCVQVRTDADTAMTKGISRVNADLVSFGLSPSIVRHPGVDAPPAGAAGVRLETSSAPANPE